MSLKPYALRAYAEADAAKLQVIMPTSDNRYDVSTTDSDFQSESALTDGPPLSHASADPSSATVDEADPADIPPEQLNYLKLRRYMLKKQYGLTLEEYVARWHAQGGCCAICHGEELTKRQGTPRMLAVDHDKVTGRIRGLLCFHCNAGLGLFRDNREALRAAIAYLENAARVLEPVPFRQIEIRGHVA